MPEFNQENSKSDIQAILSVISRQRKLLSAVVLGGILLGGLVIYLLPSIYQSKAGILIEQESMFSRNDDAKADQNISPRVHAIVRTVMTHSNIEKILYKYDLIDDSEEVDVQIEVQDFRDDTHLDFDNVEIINPLTGKEGKVSIGFSVAYENESPEIAFEITKEITGLLLTANDGKVSTEEEQRLSFLQEETKRALSALKMEEKKLAAFKDKNNALLPSINPLVVSRYEETKADLMQTDDSLQALKEKERGLLVDLSTIQARQSLYTADGRQLEGAALHLNELEAEYIEKSMGFTDSHPEMIRLKNEITTLERQVGSSNAASLTAELGSAKVQLAQARKKFTSSHPEVLALSRRVAALQKKIRSTKKSSRSKSISITSNPEYVLAKSQLDEVQDDLSKEKITKTGLKLELEALEDKLQRMPYVEQNMQIIEREFDRAESKYKEVEAQLSQAELLRNMGQANLFDRFVLVEPPIYPTKPIKPRKKIMFAVLTLLSLSIGLLVAFLREWLNNKIIGLHIMKQSGYTPVYAIPRFE
ncbi:MAG: Wzz/FepE/Etk N-terminal domain-containing protein [Gammaproteobacteria bacterium]